MVDSVGGEFPEGVRERYMGMIVYAANRHLGGLERRFDLDDLIQEGMMELWECILDCDHLDPLSSGFEATFKTRIFHRMAGICRTQKHQCRNIKADLGSTVKFVMDGASEEMDVYDTVANPRWIPEEVSTWRSLIAQITDCLSDFDNAVFRELISPSPGLLAFSSSEKDGEPPRWRRPSLMLLARYFDVTRAAIYASHRRIADEVLWYFSPEERKYVNWTPEWETA